MKKFFKKLFFLLSILLILTVQTASAQLLGLALSLKDTMAGYIFGVFLRSEKTLDIDGALDWYLKNDDTKWNCAFGYTPRSLSSVEVAKIEATKNLVSQQ